MQSGSTPLINAAGNGHTECVALLIEKGANKEAADDVSMGMNVPVFTRTLHV